MAETIGAIMTIAAIQKSKIWLLFIEIFVSALISLFPLSISYASEIVSWSNGRTVEAVADKDSYVFLVGGHLYGAPNNTLSRFPASSLLGNINELNSRNAAFFVSLGDNTRIPNARQVSAFKQSFANVIKTPLFITPGNHDLPKSPLYEIEFGPEYSTFQLKSEVFIFLNTEYPDGNLVGDQLRFFKQTLEKAVNNPRVKNIFVFSHKPIWGARRAKYDILMSHVNAPEQYNQSDFRYEVLPFLKKAAAKKNIYWGSGDIGTQGPNTQLFFHQNAADGVTYFATGLADNHADAIVQIKVNEDSKISFELISLMSEKLLNYEKYNIDFWTKNVESDIYQKAQAVKKDPIKYYLGRVMKMFEHVYFTRGVIAGIFVAFLLGLVIRRFTRAQKKGPRERVG